MRGIGSTILFFGCGSTALYLFGYEFVILTWIEYWGENVAWAIRIAMIVVGAVLYFMGGGVLGGKDDTVTND